MIVSDDSFAHRGRGPTTSLPCVANWSARYIIVHEKEKQDKQEKKNKQTKNIAKYQKYFSCQLENVKGCKWDSQDL